jgi:hypothetical protein
MMGYNSFLTASTDGMRKHFYTWLAFIYVWAASWQNQHNGFATSMDLDQPAHPSSLISIHAVRLQTITSRETDSEQHGSWSGCADAQAGLDPCWSQTHMLVFSWHGSNILILPVIDHLNGTLWRLFSVTGTLSFLLSVPTEYMMLNHWVCATPSKTAQS